jgi:hypothetical protein
LHLSFNRQRIDHASTVDGANYAVYAQRAFLAVDGNFGHLRNVGIESLRHRDAAKSGCRHRSCPSSFACGEFQHSKVAG